MATKTDNIERRLTAYEPLVFSTAQLLLSQGVEDALEDVRQLLRIKVWKALCWYDPAKTRMPEQRYVFMCLRDQAKDVLKKKRLRLAYIEDLIVAPTEGGHDYRFDERYLSSDHDEVYGPIEDPGVALPNTLSELEVQVVCLLYSAYRQTEVARRLGITKRDMERVMRSVRTKLADWQPTARLELPASAEIEPPTEVSTGESHEPLAA